MSLSKCLHENGSRRSHAHCIPCNTTQYRRWHSASRTKSNMVLCCYTTSYITHFITLCRNFNIQLTQDIVWNPASHIPLDLTHHISKCKLLTYACIYVYIHYITYIFIYTLYILLYIFLSGEIVSPRWPQTLWASHAQCVVHVSHCIRVKSYIHNYTTWLTGFAAHRT